MKKKIGICHFRVGMTDGVSLEIEKIKRALEKLNFKVVLIAGPCSKGADYVIRELEWEERVITRIKENGFNHYNRRDFDDMKLEYNIFKISDRIEKKLDKIQIKEKFDYLNIHNIFCYGGHLSAARAFANFVKKNKIKTLAHHHDFYWERDEFFEPRNAFLKKFVLTYLPPKNKYIKHIVINSMTKKDLKIKRGIVATVLPNMFDFGQSKWGIDKYNKNFLKDFKIGENDLVVLQATRIMARKGVAIAVDYVSHLEDMLGGLKNKKIYNGKKITKDSKVILLLAGYHEKADRQYFDKIKELTKKKKINAKFIYKRVAYRRQGVGFLKKYSLWDAYVFADLVTFPSIWEGWGNQFIEGIFAKKPMAVYEYNVFRKDIKKEGYEIISFGSRSKIDKKTDLRVLQDSNMTKAVNKTKEVLLDKKYNNKLNNNFKIGKKYHDIKILEDFLKKELD